MRLIRLFFVIASRILVRRIMAGGLGFRGELARIVVLVILHTGAS